MGRLDELELYSKDDIEKYYGNEGISLITKYMKETDYGCGEGKFSGIRFYWIHITEDNDGGEMSDKLENMLADKRINRWSVDLG